MDASSSHMQSYPGTVDGQNIQNPEEKIGMTPPVPVPSQMSMLNNVCVTFQGLVSFVHLSKPRGEKNATSKFGGCGVKVVHGLNISSIYVIKVTLCMKKMPDKQRTFTQTNSGSHDIFYDIHWYSMYFYVNILSCVTICQCYSLFNIVRSSCIIMCRIIICQHRTNKVKT